MSSATSSDVLRDFTYVSAAGFIFMQVYPLFYFNMNVFFLYNLKVIKLKRVFIIPKINKKLSTRYNSNNCRVCRKKTIYIVCNLNMMTC